MWTGESHPRFIVVVPLTLRKMQCSGAFKLNLIKGDDARKLDIPDKHDTT
jgi:hypothetical protein